MGYFMAEWLLFWGYLAFQVFLNLSEVSGTSVICLGRGALATQQDPLGTIRGCCAVLGLVEKAWLPFPRLLTPI